MSTLPVDVPTSSTWACAAGSGPCADCPKLPTMHFSTRVNYSGDAAIVHVVGDLDVSTAPDLRSRSLTVIDDGWTRLQIDLTACEFIDSVGLGILVAILRRARSRGGDVEIHAPFEQQRRMFALCGLDKVFVVHAEPLPETA